MAARRHTPDELELFTEEQLTYLENSRRGAVRAAVRRYRDSSLVAFLLLLGGIGFLFYDNQHDQEASQKALAAQQHALVQSGRIVAVDGCNRDFADNQKFRGLLERLRRSAETNYRLGRTTQEQYEQAVLFYNRELNNFSVIDCRESERILTDDPADLPNHVEPYYHGNPNNPPRPRG